MSEPADMAVGRRLHQAYAETFKPNGWVDEFPGWEDYDDWGHAAYQAAAEQFVALHEAAAWLPIDTAPRDRMILVFAPGTDERWEGDLGDLVTVCRWHPDAGFCVCELREPTHWRELPPAPARPA